MPAIDRGQAGTVHAHTRHSGHHVAHRHTGVHHAHHAGSHKSHVSAGKHHHSSTAKHAGRHKSTTARATHGLSERGVVNSYNAGSNTAMVQLAGATARVVGPIPVSLGVPTGSLAGKNCLVVLLDAHNMTDGVLVASW